MLENIDAQLDRLRKLRRRALRLRSKINKHIRELGTSKRLLRLRRKIEEHLDELDDEKLSLLVLRAFYERVSTIAKEIRREDERN